MAYRHKTSASIAGGDLSGMPVEAIVPAQCICDLLSISVPEVESAQYFCSKVAKYVSIRDASLVTHDITGPQPRPTLSTVQTVATRRACDCRSAPALVASPSEYVTVTIRR